MIRPLCYTCADASERWVTLYPLTTGPCRQCGLVRPLYGTAVSPPAFGPLTPTGAGTPWRCPVCAGTAQIETAFRRRMTGGWYGRRAPCLACGGRGLVWAGQDAGLRRAR